MTPVQTCKIVPALTEKVNFAFIIYNLHIVRPRLVGAKLNFESLYFWQNFQFT